MRVDGLKGVGEFIIKMFDIWYDVVGDFDIVFISGKGWLFVIIILFFSIFNYNVIFFGFENFE